MTRNYIMRKFCPAHLMLICVLVFLFTLLFSCGGGGGGGDETSLTPPIQNNVTIPGYVGDATENSPISGASCIIKDFFDQTILNDEKQPLITVANGKGNFVFNRVPIGVDGFIECFPADYPNLILSTYFDTFKAIPGQLKNEENVTPVTTVISNILRDYDAANAVADLDGLKGRRLDAFTNRTDLNLVVLAEGAVSLFYSMLKGNGGLGVKGILYSNFTSNSMYGALEDLFIHNQLVDNRWNTHPEIQNEINIKTKEISNNRNRLFSVAYKGGIRGKVINPFGNTLEGVTLVFRQEGVIWEKIESDSRGNFQTDPIPPFHTEITIDGKIVKEIQVVPTLIVDAGLIVKQ